MRTEVTVVKMRCNKCGHEWLPRREESRMCPKCKSVRWDD